MSFKAVFWIFVLISSKTYGLLNVGNEVVSLSLEGEIAYNSNLFLNHLEQGDLVYNFTPGVVWKNQDSVVAKEMELGIRLNRYLEYPEQNSEDYFLSTRFRYPNNTKSLHSIRSDFELFEYTIEDLFLGARNRYFEKDLLLEYSFAPDSLQIFDATFSLEDLNTITGIAANTDTYVFSIGASRQQTMNFLYGIKIGQIYYETSSFQSTSIKRRFISNQVKYNINTHLNCSLEAILQDRIFSYEGRQVRDFLPTFSLDLTSKFSSKSTVQFDLILGSRSQSDVAELTSNTFSVGGEHQLRSYLKAGFHLHFSDITYQDHNQLYREDQVIRFDLDLSHELSETRKYYFYFKQLLNHSNIPISDFSKTQLGMSISQIF
tara:strand:- start:3684 stop:4808 length:1125 start_codon:yes stop_codon:yes gene_type:complete